MNLVDRARAALLTSLFAAVLWEGAAIAGPQEPPPSGSPSDERWREEVIGYQEEVPIRLGELADALAKWFLPGVADNFRGPYGETFLRSTQAENWIQSYLDLRALLPEVSEATLAEALAQTLDDARAIIAQRIEQRLRAAGPESAGSVFGPGVSAEAWGEHQLRIFLTQECLALLAKILAERSTPSPTFGDVQRHYAEHPLRWAGTLRVSMIFLAFLDPTTGTRLDSAGRAAVLELAQDLRTEAQRPGVDFAELATRRSEDASTAERGGELGWLSYARSGLPEEATRVLFETSAGNVTEPVETRRGVYIFLVHERQPRTVPPLPKIEDRVAEDLRRERARRFVLESRLKHRISER